jgi:hypothetical protein
MHHPKAQLVPLEADDPRRFRRQGPAKLSSLNSGRVADALTASFGPGQAGCFGEGGSFQKISGPLAGGTFESEPEFRRRMLTHASTKQNGATTLAIQYTPEEKDAGVQVGTNLSDIETSNAIEQVLPATRCDYQESCCQADHVHRQQNAYDSFQVRNVLLI